MNIIFLIGLYTCKYMQGYSAQHFTDFLPCKLEIIWPESYRPIVDSVLSHYTWFHSCLYKFISMVDRYLCPLGHDCLELAPTSTDLSSWVELNWVESHCVGRHVFGLVVECFMIKNGPSLCGPTVNPSFVHQIRLAWRPQDYYDENWN